MNEDLRRTPRVGVCCRAVVHDRYGLWTGVTVDVSASGCRIVSPRLLRAGSRVIVTLSSDLFADELEMVGEAVWATSEHVAVSFSRPTRAAALTPGEWFEKVLEAGATAGSSPVVPALGVPPPRAIALAPRGAQPSASAARPPAGAHVPRRIQRPA